MPRQLFELSPEILADILARTMQSGCLISLFLCGDSRIHRMLALGTTDVYLLNTLEETTSGSPVMLSSLPNLRHLAICRGKHVLGDPEYLFRQIMRLSARLESLTLECNDAVDCLRPLPTSFFLDRLFRDSTGVSDTLDPGESNPIPLLDLSAHFPNLTSLSLENSKASLVDTDFAFLPRTLLSFAMNSIKPVSYYATEHLPRGLTSLALSVASECLWQDAPVLGLPRGLLTLDFYFHQPVAPNSLAMLPSSLTVFKPLYTIRDNMMRDLPRGLREFTPLWVNDSLTIACLPSLPPALVELSLNRFNRWKLDGSHLRLLPRQLESLVVDSLDWPNITHSDWPRHLVSLQTKWATQHQDWKSLPSTLTKLRVSLHQAQWSTPSQMFSDLPECLVLLSISCQGEISHKFDNILLPSTLSTLSIPTCQVPPEILDILPPGLTCLELAPGDGWSDETVRKLPTGLKRFHLANECGVTNQCFAFLPRDLTSLSLFGSGTEYPTEELPRGLLHLDFQDHRTPLGAAAVQGLPRTLLELTAMVPGEFFAYLPPDLETLLISSTAAQSRSEHMLHLPRRLKQLYLYRTDANASAYKDLPKNVTFTSCRRQDPLYAEFISQRSKRAALRLVRPDPRFRQDGSSN